MNIYFDYDDAHTIRLWVDVYTHTLNDIQSYLREQMPSVSEEEIAKSAILLLKPTVSVIRKCRDDLMRVVIEQEDWDDPEFDYEADAEPYQKMISGLIENSVKATEAEWSVKNTPMLMMPEMFCRQLRRILTEHFDCFIFELVGYIETTVFQILERRNK